MCELFADIYGLNFADKDLGIYRNFYTSQLCNGVCRPTIFAFKAPLIRMVFLTFSISPGFKK